MFFVVKALHFHPLHFHKPYLAYLKINFNDFYEIRCAKKGVTKSFQGSKAIDQCVKSYKSFSHTCLPYHIKNIICSSLNEHTPNNLSYILYPKKKIIQPYKHNFFFLSSNIVLYV
jgi:hypothetical protein